MVTSCAWAALFVVACAPMDPHSPITIGWVGNQTRICWAMELCMAV